MASVKSIKEILGVASDFSETDEELVTNAYTFAQQAHENQKRYSGDPYFLHVAEVAYELAELGLDAPAIAAGLLHDTIEDATATEEEIRERFGDEVLALVDGVTKLGSLKYRGLERHTESLRKLFAATAQDIRVLIIKLTDRLHNARTLEHVPAHKRKRIAMETLEIYAPIADRLGMGILKRELEDAAFPHAYPKEYEQVRAVMKERSSENEKRLDKTEKTLKKELAKSNIRDFRLEARRKGLYSLFRKLERKDWDATKIHDILALRVIVKNTADCYAVLGAIHQQWTPMPGKIKDYIAFPKPNGYQSIHTTIHTGDGGTLEIQIRTEEMHREAQYGIASHFTYKEAAGYVKGGKIGSGLEWIRQLLPGTRPSAQHDATATGSNASVPEWVKELAEARQDADDEDEYIGSLKADYFNHRVFTFTPEQDVIDLPIDATPVDFAYAVHSDIGNHVSGAKVNGKMVTLDTPLRNGDTVEIVTKRTSKPTRKWLEFVKTSMAKKHIRNALSTENKLS